MITHRARRRRPIEARHAADGRRARRSSTTAGRSIAEAIPADARAATRIPRTLSTPRGARQQGLKARRRAASLVLRALRRARRRCSSSSARRYNRRRESTAWPGRPRRAPASGDASPSCCRPTARRPARGGPGRSSRGRCSRRTASRRADRGPPLRRRAPGRSPLPSVARSTTTSPRACARGAVVADAVNWAKRLIDRRPATCSPKELATASRQRLEDDPHVDRRDLDATPRSRGAPRRAARRRRRARASPRAWCYATYDPSPAALAARGARRQGHHLRLGRPLAQDRRRHDDDEDRHDRAPPIVLAALSIASAAGAAPCGSRRSRR